MRTVIVGVAVAALSGSAFGQVWLESGDAPSTVPGQGTSGNGPLATIRGALNNNSSDFVDLFTIRITNPAGFSATTDNGGTLVDDTQLWLFRLDGHGVTFNDDHPNGLTLLSRITGVFVPAPGLYVLGISAYDSDPFDSNGLELWLDLPFDVERQPDGPGAQNALSFWEEDGGAPDGLYQIDLTGASFAVPAPGSGAVLLGAGALGSRRRRRG